MRIAGNIQDIQDEVTNEKEKIVWYAMRATYRRELAVKKILDELSIESFIPMRYEIIVEKGRKKKRLVPIIHNLIFVHATLSVVKEVKGRIQHLQYMMHTVDGTLSKILCKWEQDSVISFFLYLDSVFKDKYKLVHNQSPV